VTARHPKDYPRPAWHSPRDGRPSTRQTTAPTPPGRRSPRLPDDTKRAPTRRPAPAARPRGRPCRPARFRCDRSRPGSRPRRAHRVALGRRPPRSVVRQAPDSQVVRSPPSRSRWRTKSAPSAHLDRGRMCARDRRRDGPRSMKRGLAFRRGTRRSPSWDSTTPQQTRASRGQRADATRRRGPSVFPGASSISES
jgi:hypothetical protein